MPIPAALWSRSAPSPSLQMPPARPPTCQPQRCVKSRCAFLCDVTPCLSQNSENQKPDPAARPLPQHPSPSWRPTAARCGRRIRWADSGGMSSPASSPGQRRCQGGQAPLLILRRRESRAA